MSADPGAAAPPEVAARRSRPLLVVAIVAAVVLVDQITKSLALDRLAHRSVPVIGSLRFDLSFNTGLSFGQGRGLTGPITAVGVVLVVGLVWWSRRVTSTPATVAVSLLIGGACGNLADRLFRDHGGAVIDFIDLQWWPVFNVADIAITAGAILLVVASLRDADGVGG